jgi:hypothetical protein
MPPADDAELKAAEAKLRDGKMLSKSEVTQLKFAAAKAGGGEAAAGAKPKPKPKPKAASPRGVPSLELPAPPGEAHASLWGASLAPAKSPRFMAGTSPRSDAGGAVLAPGGVRAKSAGDKPRSKKLDPETMRRLCAVPAHKVKVVNRHFPSTAPVDKGQVLLRQSKSGSELSTTIDAVQQALHQTPDAPRTLGDSKSRARLGGAGLSPNARSVEPAEERELRLQRRRANMTLSSLRRVFKWLDTKGDGFLDAEELHQGQLVLGGTISLSECQDMIWEVDDGSDSEIYISEIYISEITLGT